MLYYCRKLIASSICHSHSSTFSSTGLCPNTCRTKATQIQRSSVTMPAKIYCRILSLRKLSKKEFIIHKGSIGRGVFGSCYVGKLGPLEVCLKCFRNKNTYDSDFYTEAVLLSLCCHSNLPWFYGILLTPKVIVQSFHSFDGKSCSLHKILHHSDDLDSKKISTQDWKRIILGVVSAVEYIHGKEILHNDIKSDNIIVDDRPSIHSVLVDFGKGCLVDNAKHYNLTDVQKCTYSHDHPQVAPEVRDGLSKQSKLSDIYSVGRVLHQVNEKTLKIPMLCSYSRLCLKSNYTERPTSSDLVKAFSNIFDL